MRADRRGWTRGCGRVLAKAPCVFGLVAFLVLGLGGGQLALGHTPTIDSDLSDWCLFTAARVEDSWAELTCAFGSETVWWDAPADSAVNDLATVATTQDGTNLYWAAELHVDPDPTSLPFAQIAIDVVSGGSAAWWDPFGNLKTPGHCSVDTDRLCTKDEDCHFCTKFVIYPGTPLERPRPCGTTDAGDSCDDFDPTDLCIRTQTCVDLGVGPAIPNVGINASPVIEPDYLIVFDFGRWFLFSCDATKLKRADGGGWVDIPRAVPEPLCTPAPCEENMAEECWRLLPAVDPGETGGSGGPPGKIELAIPWEAFDCDGCPTFEPGTEFRWSIEVNRGDLSNDYAPDGAVEDVMSEAVAGTFTTTSDSCSTPGTATTLCETTDGTTDAFVPPAAAAPGGSVEESLRVQRNNSGTPTPEITITWGPSCSSADTDYEVYAGNLDLLPTYSHVPILGGGGCSTGGATRVTFNAGAGNEYYLTVPTDGITGGSYGETDDTTVPMPPERPFSTSACTPQSLGTCP